MSMPRDPNPTAPKSPMHQVPSLNILTFLHRQTRYTWRTDRVYLPNLWSRPQRSLLHYGRRASILITDPVLFAPQPIFEVLPEDIRLRPARLPEPARWIGN